MDTNLFYIVDAGGSKTDLVFVNKGERQEFSFAGFNPNSTDSSTLTDLKSKIENKEAPVYFYGSGLNDPKQHPHLQSILNLKNLHIFGDVLGSARSVLGINGGIVSILGTGAVVAHYQNQKIQTTKGGYGYLLDDIGGGYELGRRVLSKWLNGDLNTNSHEKITAFFKQSPEDFIHYFYQTKDIKIISKICTILPDLIQEDIRLERTVLDYFDLFVKTHVKQLAQSTQNNIIHFTGSIAYFFQKQLQTALQNHDLELGKVLAKPIDGLVEFYKLQK